MTRDPEIKNPNPLLAPAKTDAIISTPARVVDPPANQEQYHIKRRTNTSHVSLSINGTDKSRSSRSDFQTVGTQTLCKAILPRR